MSTPRHYRVLGLDLRPRRTGYVCIESRNVLVDFGVATHSSIAKAEARIHFILHKSRPTVLVLREIGPDSRRYELKTLALRKVVQSDARLTHTRVGIILDSQLRDFFALHSARTEHEMATRIAERYPELVWRLPHPRKPWEPQPRYMPLFDAAALALAFIELSKRGELFAGLPAV